MSRVLWLVASGTRMAASEVEDELVCAVSGKTLHGVTPRSAQFSAVAALPRLITMSGWKEIVDSIPSHCADDMTRIARSRARSWLVFADET